MYEKKVVKSLKAVNFQSGRNQVSDIKTKIETMKEWFQRFGDRIGGTFNKDEYGHLIILLGQRKTGKSETVKTLCKQISGNKYVVKFDGNLLPTKIPDDDKNDWEKISGVSVIEDTNQLQKQDAGLLIIEDYPALSDDGKNTLYNKIKDSRHKGYQANYIIIAHDFAVLKGEIFNAANAILIYNDAAITPQGLGARLGSQSLGWHVHRAKADMKQFEYIFISFDHKKWHNTIHIDTRDVDILKKTVKGRLKEAELKEINFPNKKPTKSASKRSAKKARIIALMKQGIDYDDINTIERTTLGTIYKIKSQEKRKYREKQGWSKNTPDSNYPEWLQDRR